MDIEDNSSSTVTRYPRVNALLLDGDPLTGVRSFFFDAGSGLGHIEWWKANPADYDRPDLPYIGTVRTTSPVLLTLSLTSTAEQPTPSRRPDTRASVELFIDGMRTALAKVESEADFADLMTFLLEHGYRTPETDGDVEDALKPGEFDDIR
ncbi:hypothetical protein ACFV3I_13555 [Microbacterium sp. NPDC059771]|uniref:hypothetical protein n=1 Tax=Microbacterium sp. NPDC059771 TaxID=3346941 RepID=UPI0036619FB0